MEVVTRIISPGFLKVLRNNGRVIEYHRRKGLRSCSITSYNIYKDHDPAPIFFDKNVQDILKRVTGMNFSKVFQRRYKEESLKPPKYEFLTDVELEEQMEKAKERAKSILQMPPVVKERQPKQEILSSDPTLTGYDSCKYVFTDITFGMSDTKRIIVVREPDGTLRQATWEERDRMNQVYNPAPGRSLLIPKVFQEENLRIVLEREEYQFLLDRACAQFEPDDAEYQRVTSIVYEAVDARRTYSALHSTRHYGPLCFYLTWHRKIDSLLISLIQDEMLSNAADIVKLYQMIHKDCKSTALNIDPEKHLDFIKGYLEQDSLQRAQLQLAIQAYEDLLQQRQQHQEHVTTAHGL